MRLARCSTHRSSAPTCWGSTESSRQDQGMDSRPLDSVTVAYLGHYDPEYARNRTLIKALERAGASVVRITDRRRFLARTPRLARSALRTRPDVILVGFPGHSDVPMAKLISLCHRCSGDLQHPDLPLGDVRRPARAQRSKPLRLALPPHRPDLLLSPRDDLARHADAYRLVRAGVRCPGEPSSAGCGSAPTTR